MDHLYDIIIEGNPVKRGLSEGEFFDLMEDLATAYYETGYPDLSKVTHLMYPKEDYNVRKDSAED